MKNGDIAVVALPDHDISLKATYFEGDNVLLHPANRDYRPVMLDYPGDLEIIGKAVMVSRKLG